MLRPSFSVSSGDWNARPWGSRTPRPSVSSEGEEGEDGGGEPLPDLDKDRGLARSRNRLGHQGEGQESGQEGEGERAGDSADHRISLAERRGREAPRRARRVFPQGKTSTGRVGGWMRSRRGRCRRPSPGLKGRQSPAQG